MTMSERPDDMSTAVMPPPPKKPRRQKRLTHVAPIVTRGLVTPSPPAAQKRSFNNKSHYRAASASAATSPASTCTAVTPGSPAYRTVPKEEADQPSQGTFHNYTDCEFDWVYEMNTAMGLHLRSDSTASSIASSTNSEADTILLSPSDISTTTSCLPGFSPFHQQSPTFNFGGGQLFSGFEFPNPQIDSPWLDWPDLTYWDDPNDDKIYSIF